MHNNVVVACVLFFQKLGITTVRFDFGGWQLSRGTGQVEQIQRVATALTEGRLSPNQQQQSTKTAPKSVLLVGYSYGSLLSSSASADIANVCGVISIAPPYQVQHWLLLFHQKHHMEQSVKCNCPKLLILGDKDNFTSEAAFQKIVETKFPSATGAILKNADHFFGGRERDLMNVIAEWIQVTFECNDMKDFRDWKAAPSVEEANSSAAEAPAS